MTTTALVPRKRIGAIAALEDHAQKAHDFAANADASATRRAYASDMADFRSWCEAHGLDALPALPQTVACYLANLASERTTSTLQRRLSAIARAHREANLDSPTEHSFVRLEWRGIRRAKGIATAKKAALSVTDLRGMLATLPDSLLGLRDRALLLVGFAGGFRRSELVALTVEDARVASEGVVLTLRRSKTDQEGEGRIVGIPRGRHTETCPVRALEAWTLAAKVTTGPLLRAVDRHGNVSNEAMSDRTIARVVQRAAIAAGLDASAFAGHSLRAGLATSAASAGASERAIMAQTGHKSERIMRGYIRLGTVWHENAARALDL